MKVRIQRTAATEVDATGYNSVDQCVTVVASAAVTPRRKARKATLARRTRAVLHRRQVDLDGLVEVTVVRSSRNRLGGGARARPAPARQTR